MAVQYAFSQITTTGLKLAVDAADPLSYPGSGTTWTDVTGNGFTGTISSSISFATTNRGALVSSNSSSAVSFSGSAADFGQGSFTIEMAFSPSRISGTHWLYSKNSGSFPNFGAYITGSSGSGRIVAFYNVSSTVSSSVTTATGSIVTGSNYVLDVTYIPNNLFTGIYLNSTLTTTSGANGTGSLSTSASLLLLNNTTASSAGTMGNLYNFKVYNPYINPANIRKNYNSMCSRFGLPLALYTPYAPLLLDIYTGAAAAYSLRRLSDFYGGSAIRVRRSSDNTEQDIGFLGNDLDTTSLLSFVGGGNGFVTTWYDQSGNGRNATQSTAANQPQIVSSGNIILENTKPAIQFDGSNDNLSINSFSNTSSNSIFVVENRNRQSTGTTDFPFSFVRDRIYFDKNTYFQMASNSGNYLINSMINTTNLQELLSLFYSNNGAIYKNNNIQSSSLSFNPFNNSSNSTIGSADSNSLFAQVKHQELIYYTSDQSSNRTGIESNINSYYSIY